MSPNLPILSCLSKSTEKSTFKDYVIVLIQHLLKIEEVKAFLESFLRCGCTLRNLFIVGIPYSSKDQVVQQLRRKFKVRFPRKYPFDEDIRQVLEKACKTCKKKGKKLLIIEDGGYAVPMIHEKFSNYISYCYGAVEQTNRGIWNDKELEKQSKLEIPIIGIPDCILKRDVESLFIAPAVVNNIENLLFRRNKTRYSVVGKKVAIVGYGTIGKAIAKVLKDKHAQVHIADVSELRLVTAILDGYSTQELNALAGWCHIMIGATGRESIGRNAILALPHEAILASASSRRIEIDVQDLKNLSSREKNIPNVGTEYTIQGTGRKILLLADGYPVNFFRSESVLLKDIDLIISELFLGAVALANRGKDYLGSKRINEQNLNSIHKGNEVINEEEVAGLYRRFYML